jgi:hypothetical protein
VNRTTIKIGQESKPEIRLAGFRRGSRVSPRPWCNRHLAGSAIGPIRRNLVRDRYPVRPGSWPAAGGASTSRATRCGTTIRHASNTNSRISSASSATTRPSGAGHQFCGSPTRAWSAGPDPLHPLANLAAGRSETRTLRASGACPSWHRRLPTRVPPARSSAGRLCQQVVYGSPA